VIDLLLTWIGGRDNMNTAAVDWEAAIGSLDEGSFPSSAGENWMLRLAASLAGGTASCGSKFPAGSWSCGCPG
jgi:hypothetical protein